MPKNQPTTPPKHRGRTRIYANNAEKSKAYKKRHNIQTIAVNVSIESKDKIKAAADSEGMSVSQFVLTAVEKQIKSDETEDTTCG